MTYSRTSAPPPGRASAGGSPLLLLAVVVLAAGLTVPGLRDAEGFLTGALALPLGAAAGLACAGFGRLRGWGAGAGWAGLALVGQGAVLALVEAGSGVGYQHLALQPRTLSGPSALAGVVLALQAALLLWRGRPVARAAARAVSRALGPWGAGFVAAAFVLTSATLSQELGYYLSELVVAGLLQGLQLWTVALAAQTVPDHAARGMARRVRTALSGVDGGPDPFPWVLAAWTVTVAALLSWFAYQRHPHVPDEVVYLLQARYLAAGLLELPLPPVVDGFDVDLMTYDPDRWFSPVPPGWPAMLAVGAALGVPWLVNPVLGGVAVLLTPRVVEQVYDDRRVARLTTVLLATSPWFLFMSMNFMTHTFTLVAALAAAWTVGRTVRGGSGLWLVAGGLAIGVVALIRPLEGMVMAAALGFWCLVAGSGGWVRRVGRTGILAAFTAAATAAVFPYNVHFTGSATHFPIMDYTDRVYGPGVNAMGFGPDRGIGWSGLDPFPGHGPLDVLVNGNLNAFQVNVELLGWGAGSVGLLALALSLNGWWRSRGDRGMLFMIGLVVGAHALYWFSGGPDFGARYWYLILVPALALAARGLLGIEDRLGGGSRTWVAAGVLIAGALLVFMPWRAVDKYHHYRGMRPDVRVLAEEYDFGEALVLVRGNRHPDYASAAIYNPLDLREGEGPIYAWDRSPEVRRALLEAYPDRPVWLMDGPTVTGRGFEVVEGPITDRIGLADR